MWLVFLCAVSRGADSPRDFSPHDFAGPVYEFKDGAFIMDADAADYSGAWQLLQKPYPGTKGGCNHASPGTSMGHTGSGYLRWNGANLTCAAQNQPEGVNHSDINQTCQGNKEDWLVFKVYAPIDMQLLKFSARLYHEKEDGDNDFWFGRIGQTELISRGGNCITNVFAWEGWPNSVAIPLPLKKGINAIYVTGRSPGIGIDRIVLYMEPRKDYALDPASPVSPIQNVSVFRCASILRSTSNNAIRLVTAIAPFTPGTTFYNLQGKQMTLLNQGAQLNAAPTLLIARP